MTGRVGGQKIMRKASIETRQETMAVMESVQWQAVRKVTIYFFVFSHVGPSLPQEKTKKILDNEKTGRWGGGKIS